MTTAKRPCTQQPPRARATRASQAALRSAPAARRLTPVTPVNREIASLQPDAASSWWTLTQNPAVKLRETCNWTKSLDVRQSWVFVCRKAFDPTSAKKWFKDNRVKVHPRGPWETVNGGRVQNKWPVDGGHGEGPCDDFYKTVNNYLGAWPRRVQGMHLCQVCAACLIVQVCDCVCCCRQGQQQASSASTLTHTSGVRPTARSHTLRKLTTRPLSDYVLILGVIGCFLCVAV